MRVCETVLSLAAADWIHRAMEGCPATGCPFVGEVRDDDATGGDGEESDGRARAAGEACAHMHK